MTGNDTVDSAQLTVAKLRAWLDGKPDGDRVIIQVKINWADEAYYADMVNPAPWNHDYPPDGPDADELRLKTVEERGYLVEPAHLLTIYDWCGE